jgi:hypothetical protein
LLAIVVASVVSVALCHAVVAIVVVVVVSGVVSVSVSATPPVQAVSIIIAANTLKNFFITIYSFVNLFILTNNRFKKLRGITHAAFGAYIY